MDSTDADDPLLNFDVDSFIAFGGSRRFSRLVDLTADDSEESEPEDASIASVTSPQTENIAAEEMNHPNAVYSRTNFASRSCMTACSSTYFPVCPPLDEADKNDSCSSDDNEGSFDLPPAVTSSSPNADIVLSPVRNMSNPLMDELSLAQTSKFTPSSSSTSCMVASSTSTSCNPTTSSSGAPYDINQGTVNLPPAPTSSSSTNTDSVLSPAAGSNNFSVDLMALTVTTADWVYCQGSKGNYYSNQYTGESVYEAIGAEQYSGWVVEKDCYSGKLKKYRNLFSGENLYGQQKGDLFGDAKPTPLNALVSPKRNFGDCNNGVSGETNKRNKIPLSSIVPTPYSSTAATSYAEEREVVAEEKKLKRSGSSTGTTNTRHDADSVGTAPVLGAMTTKVLNGEGGFMKLIVQTEQDAHLSKLSSAGYDAEATEQSEMDFRVNRRDDKTMQMRKDVGKQTLFTSSSVGQPSGQPSGIPTHPSGQPSGAPPISNFSTPNKFPKNTLSLQYDKHSGWMFGGIAEIVHNAADAQATKLCISHFVDDEHDNEDVIEFLDNGTGMSPAVVADNLMCIGRNDDGDNKGGRIGRYGVGFKQGTMRVGSTTVFITKHIETETLTIGIICNRPYEEHKQHPVYKHATLSYPGLRPNTKWTSKEDYNETAELVASWSFLNRESIAKEVDKRFTAANEGGTVIFIQHWRRLRDELFVDKENWDFKLSSKNLFTNKTVPFRQCRPLLPENATVTIDSSLREYLTYCFKEPEMNIYLMEKKVESKKIVEVLEGRGMYTVLPAENGFSAVSATIGKNAQWKEHRLGGAMFYSENVLIMSFERSLIGITSQQDGWGVVMVVEVDGCGIETTQEKQRFVDSERYHKLRQGMNKAYEDYSRKQYESTETELSSEKNSWLACANCNKWRRVSYAVCKKYTPADMSYFCFEVDSPVMIDILKTRPNDNVARSMACDVPPDVQENDEYTLPYHPLAGVGSSAGYDVVSDSNSPTEQYEELFHTMEPGDVVDFTWNGNVNSFRRFHLHEVSNDSFYNEDNLFNHVKDGSGDYRSAFTSCTNSERWAIYYAQRQLTKHTRKFPIFKFNLSECALEHGKNVFDLSTKEKQKNHFNTTQMKSQCSNWSVDAMEVVVKAEIQAEFICAMYDPFPRVKAKSKLRSKLQKIVGSADSSFAEWNKQFERLFSTQESTKSLLEEMLVPIDERNKVLDREFEILPQVPRWLSEEFEKILKGSCRTVDKLLQNDQWTTMGATAAKKITSILKKNLKENEYEIPQTTANLLKKLSEKLKSKY